MARLILNTEETMTIETVLVDEEVIFEQRLLLPHETVAMAVESHGEVLMQEPARPDGWQAGELQVAEALEMLGQLELRGGTPVGGTREGMAIYSKARSWFGVARGLSDGGWGRFPGGALRLRLVPPGTCSPDEPGVEL